MVLMKELYWFLLMVLYREPGMAFMRDQHWDSHLDLLMVKRLDLMKESYLVLLMVNCLSQHLELQMESNLDLMKKLCWVLQSAPLMVVMKANLRVTCLEIDWDKKLVLNLVLLVVLWTEIMIAYWREEHSGSHFVHLLDL